MSAGYFALSGEQIEAKEEKCFRGGGTKTSTYTRSIARPEDDFTNIYDS